MDKLTQATLTCRKDSNNFHYTTSGLEADKLTSAGMAATPDSVRAVMMGLLVEYALDGYDVEYVQAKSFDRYEGTDVAPVTE